MNYLLSVVQPAGGTKPEPDALAAIMTDVEAVRQQMVDAGAWVFGGGLDQPGTATMLRRSGGDIVATDGPYAESKEYLGGLTIIDAPGLDAALDWGRKLAKATTLPIEVRPFYDA